MNDEAAAPAKYPGADSALEAVVKEYENHEERLKQLDQRSTTLVGFCGAAVGVLLGFLAAPGLHFPCAIRVILTASVVLVATVGVLFVRTMRYREGFRRVSCSNIVTYKVLMLPDDEAKAAIASTYLEAVEANDIAIDAKIGDFSWGIRFLQYGVAVACASPIMWCIISWCT